MIQSLENLLTGVGHGVELVNNWLWVVSGLLFYPRDLNMLLVYCSEDFKRDPSTEKYHVYFNIL